MPPAELSWQAAWTKARIVRVIGMASAVPLDKTDPDNAINRRISLIVMNRDAQQVIEQERQCQERRVSG